MKQVVGILMVAGLLAGCAENPRATLAPYPAKGQTAEQQQRDDAECQAWARQTTGYDPGTSTAKGAGIGALVGALGGAAAGAAIGAATGSAGTGAAIGAAAGGIGGAATGGTMQYTKSKESYERAYGNCMTAKGYTVGR